MRDLRDMRLKVTDFSKNAELCDAIRRYYTLLKMSFDTTNIFKIYETPNSQIYRFATPQVVPLPQQMPTGDVALVNFECPNCKTKTEIQANLGKGKPVEQGAIPFPRDNAFVCPACTARIDLSTLRRQIESQTKKRIVWEAIMSEEGYKFSIVFESLDKLSEEDPEIHLKDDELTECEEIRVLREIVLELQTPTQSFFTTT